MDFRNRLRAALEAFYERFDDRLDVFPADDLSDVPVPYILTERAA